MASGNPGQPPRIRLRFKRADLELSPDKCDVSLEAPVSEPLRGVLQSYGVWEHQRLQAISGTRGRQPQPEPKSEPPAREAASQGIGAGGDKAGEGVRKGESDAGRGSGDECGVPAAALRHWESLNFFPVHNLVYVNPSKTPRAIRLRDSHLLKVTSKKAKEETGAARPIGASEARVGTAGTGGADFESVLAAELEARLTVSEASGEGPPAASDGTVSDGTLSDGTGCAETPGTGHLPQADKTEEGDRGLVQGRGGLGSAEEEGVHATRPLDLLALVDRALAHRHKGDALNVQGKAVEAALEYTSGCEVLDGARHWADEPSARMRLLFQDSRCQLHGNRAFAYKMLMDRAEKGRQKKLARECLKRNLRESLTLVELEPSWAQAHTYVADALQRLGNNAAAMELLSQAETNCEDGPQEARETRQEFFGRGVRSEGGGEAGRARRKAALREGIQELETWESKAGGDREWLLRLKADPASLTLLGNACDQYFAMLMLDPHAAPLAELYKGIPYSDTLLLYSDPELLALENTDPAAAPRVSYLQELMKEELPGGLYGELGTGVEGEGGQEGRAGGAAGGAGSSNGTGSAKAAPPVSSRGPGKGKGAGKRRSGKGLSKKGPTSAPFPSPAPAPGPEGSCSGGSDSNGAAGEVLQRNLELARRCNVLGNRDAAEGRLPQAALWYTRGLFLAFPTAWAKGALSLSTLPPEPGPPGTRALALALLCNRGGVLLALVERAGMSDELREQARSVARAGAIWCVYHGGPGFAPAALLLVRSLEPALVRLKAEWARIFGSSLNFWPNYLGVALRSVPGGESEQPLATIAASLNGPSRKHPHPQGGWIVSGEEVPGSWEEGVPRGVSAIVDLCRKAVVVCRESNSDEFIWLYNLELKSLTFYRLRALVKEAGKKGEW